MKIAVLISDFGVNSPHVELAKFAIESSSLYDKVVILTNSLIPHQIIEAGYFTSIFLYQFGTETDFFLALDVPNLAESNEIVLSQIDNINIISYNTGVQYVIANKSAMQCKVIGKYTQDHRYVIQKGFLPAIKKPESIHTPIRNLHFKLPIIEPNTLTGHVMYIDQQGNAHTNIDRSLFNEFIDSSFTIHLSRHEKSTKIYNHLGEVPPGKTICHWNEVDKLCVSTQIGSAQKLVGLKVGRVIEIEKA